MPSDSLSVQASVEPEITPILHISAWGFGIMRGLLRFLQNHTIIDQYDVDEIVRFHETLIAGTQGPDRFCLHYRLYDDPPKGRFSVEDRVVGTSYDYTHTVRAEAIDAASAISEL
jgi:hypothetical protein